MSVLCLMVGFPLGEMLSESISDRLNDTDVKMSKFQRSLRKVYLDVWFALSQAYSYAAVIFLRKFDVLRGLVCRQS